ncbi:MAG TPA: ATP-grasp domain-containing protein [Candidatus Altiarchaeales archaeon]|nr:ATP-grasp domain-containing protein [Candidatus Altiarchaeales archaeon]
MTTIMIERFEPMKGNETIDKIGVIGINSRAVAKSAKKLGFGVYLVDYFKDLDTLRSADHVFSLQRDELKPNLREEYSQKRLVEFAIDVLKDKVDSIILTSKVGCNYNLINKLENYFEILGNGAKRVERVKKWRKLRRLLKEAGILYPETKRFKNETEFPCILRSSRTWKIMSGVIESERELEIQNREDYLIQRYINGMQVSASLLSDGERAVTLTLNRQLIGINEFNAEKLTYCGNIVPLKSHLNEKIAEISEKLISMSGLVGSVGVDFIISDEKIYFMEINPRFQDTIENVEKYLGTNLVKKHLEALKGILDVPKSGKGCLGKAILFADKRIRMGNLRITNVGDIPVENAIIQRNEPICSIYAEGRDNEEVYYDLIRRAQLIQERYCF